ncbi:MAG: hypothetical protein AB7E80_04120 [Hyphomicrobiaceae bacterium]
MRASCVAAAVLAVSAAGPVMAQSVESPSGSQPVADAGQSWANRSTMRPFVGAEGLRLLEAALPPSGATATPDAASLLHAKLNSGWTDLARGIAAVAPDLADLLGIGEDGTAVAPIPEAMLSTTDLSATLERAKRDAGEARRLAAEVRRRAEELSLRFGGGPVEQAVVAEGAKLGETAPAKMPESSTVATEAKPGRAPPEGRMALGRAVGLGIEPNDRSPLSGVAPAEPDSGIEVMAPARSPTPVPAAKPAPDAIAAVPADPPPTQQPERQAAEEPGRPAGDAAPARKSDRPAPQRHRAKSERATHAEAAPAAASSPAPVTTWFKPLTVPQQLTSQGWASD